MRIGTVMLGVREMDRSLAFYRDALGLVVRHASSEFSFLDGGGVALALRQAAGLERVDDGRWAEIVFQVEDVDAAYGELSARGVEFRVEPRIVTGAQLAADFRDPDGHVLSILGPRRSQ
jgi:catechol 2,3-dioxygenase-like lactoylglutathione lyase family enzyme